MGGVLETFTTALVSFLTPSERELGSERNKTNGECGNSCGNSYDNSDRADGENVDKDFNNCSEKERLLCDISNLHEAVTTIFMQLDTLKVHVQQLKDNRYSGGKNIQVREAETQTETYNAIPTYADKLKEDHSKENKEKILKSQIQTAETKKQSEKGQKEQNKPISNATHVIPSYVKTNDVKKSERENQKRYELKVDSDLPMAFLVHDSVMNGIQPNRLVTGDFLNLAMEPKRTNGYELKWIPSMILCGIQIALAVPILVFFQETTEKTRDHCPLYSCALCGFLKVVTILWNVVWCVVEALFTTAFFKRMLQEDVFRYVNIAIVMEGAGCLVSCVSAASATDMFRIICYETDSGDCISHSGPVVVADAHSVVSKLQLTLLFQWISFVFWLIMVVWISLIAYWKGIDILCASDRPAQAQAPPEDKPQELQDPISIPSSTGSIYWHSTPESLTADV